MAFRIPDYYPGADTGSSSAPRVRTSGSSSAPRATTGSSSATRTGTRSTAPRVSTGTSTATRTGTTGSSAPRGSSGQSTRTSTAKQSTRTTTAKQAPRTTTATKTATASPTTMTAFSTEPTTFTATPAVTAPTAPVAPVIPDYISNYTPAAAPTDTGPTGSIFTQAAPTTETIQIPDATADSTYQQQVAALARALTNYQAQQNLALGQYNQNYNNNLRDLGWNTSTGWDPTGQGAYGQTFGANEGDFAGRGAYNSGQYLESVGDINNAFGQQKTAMDNALSQYQATQQLAGNQYQEQNTLDKQNALQNAVSRIAAQYGVDLNTVPQGTGTKTLTRPIGSAVTS